MSDTKKIVYSIIQFLNAQLQDGGLSQDSQESLEVALQCLETSFGLTANDSHLGVDKPLPQIFADGLQQTAQTAGTSAAAAPAPPAPPAPEATPEQKEQAEALKNEGNIAVREERLHEAVDKYTQAIEHDGNNAAYFSNRAAAYTKLGNYLAAVEDAERALQIDPTYTKAYSRLALAYAGLNRFEEAQAQIKKALELDPANESYLNNLRVIETRMAESIQVAGGPGGLAGMAGGFGQFANMAGAGGLNLESMLNNPAMMNVATQMMQDPNMQQMMNNMMGGAGGLPGVPGVPGAPGAGAGAPAAGPGGFEALLQAGQRLAEQMRTTNPELIDQLRQQMGGPGGPGGPQPPPPPPPPTSGDS